MRTPPIVRLVANLCARLVALQPCLATEVCKPQSTLFQACSQASRLHPISQDEIGQLPNYSWDLNQPCGGFSEWLLRVDCNYSLRATWCLLLNGPQPPALRSTPTGTMVNDHQRPQLITWSELSRLLQGNSEAIRRRWHFPQLRHARLSPLGMSSPGPRRRNHLLPATAARGAPSTLSLTSHKPCLG